MGNGERGTGTYALEFRARGRDAGVRLPARPAMSTSPAMDPSSAPKAGGVRPALILLALAGLVGCAQAPPVPGQPELAHLRIEGNRALGDSAIEGKIATTADSWIPLSDKKFLDAAVLRTDTIRIARLYQAHGYFDAKVERVEVKPQDPSGSKVDVVIHVSEGQPSRVTGVGVQGDDGLPARLRKRIARQLRRLRVGEPFDEGAYNDVAEKLRDALHDHGYALAKVAGRVTVDPVAHTAAIAFTLTPGDVYRIGRILVSGTRKVPLEKVAHEVANVAEPGTLYTDAKVQAAQSRVFDLGVFALAKVTRGVPDPATHTLPLAVSVDEAPFRTVRLGFGLGFERSRDEVHVLGEYINRNFFGGLRRLDFNNRLAYVATPDVFTYAKGKGAGGLAGSSQLTFTQPDVLVDDLDLNLTGAFQRDIQVGYSYNAVLTAVGLERRFGHVVDLSLQYNFQVLQLHSVLNDPALFAETTAPQLATSCTDPTCFLVLGYLEQRAVIDLRDDPLVPRRGIFALLDVQEGGGPGASFTYLRFEPDLRGYVPLGRRVVAAMRLHWGWMHGFGKNPDGTAAPTPITQRFFAGGPNSVRAYGSRLMSPVEVVCRDTDPAAIQKNCQGPGAKPDAFQAVPVGGDGLYEASLSLRFDISHGVGLEAFFDAALVPSQGPFHLHPEDLALAPGLGLRYVTLFGPIRLDFAYRLPGLHGGDGLHRLAPSQVVINYPPGGQGFISPGPTGRFDFQFSIGEAY